MSSVIWTRKPAFGWSINRANPLARGLIRVFNPAIGIDPIVPTSRLVLGAGHAVIQHGNLITGTGGSASTTYGDLSEISGTQQHSSLAIATPTTLAVRNGLWSAGAAGNGPGWGMGYGSASKVFAYVSNVTYVAEGGTNVFVANERAAFGWVYNYTGSAQNKFFKNGRLVHSSANIGADTGPDNGTNTLKPGGPHTSGAGSLSAWQGGIELILWWNRALTDSEVALISANPFSLFLLVEDLDFAPSAGAGSHAATGDLLAGNAEIAGTAAHFTLHVSTGALTAQAAAIAGTAAHSVGHAATGALSADAATIAGTAARTSSGVFAASGALSADAASIAGTATHLTLHTATGALVAGSATIAGVAAHPTAHDATGSLVASSASISGSAINGAEEIRGRRRRTRTYKPPVEETPEQVEQIPAPNVKAPTTTLMPDAQHIVIASVSKAQRLSKSAAVKRRMAIELADEQALDALLMSYF